MAAAAAEPTLAPAAAPLAAAPAVQAAAPAAAASSERAAAIASALAVFQQAGILAPAAPAAESWSRGSSSFDGSAAPAAQRVSLGTPEAPVAPRSFLSKKAKALTRRVGAMVLAATTLFPSLGLAQFGQNPTQYHTHHTQVMTTPHFKIYFDKDSAVATQEDAHAAELWYDIHSKDFRHEFIHKDGPNKGKPYKLPVILYPSDPSFWETPRSAAWVRPRESAA